MTSLDRRVVSQVGMTASAGKDKVVAVDLVEKQPIRFDVQIAPAAPIARQCMVLEAWRKRLGFNEHGQDFTQFPHVLAPPFRPPGVTAELAGMDRCSD
jgi:hypothetical protein